MPRTFKKIFGLIGGWNKNKIIFIKEGTCFIPLSESQKGFYFFFKFSQSPPWSSLNTVKETEKKTVRLLSVGVFPLLKSLASAAGEAHTEARHSVGLEDTRSMFLLHCLSLVN